MLWSKKTNKINISRRLNAIKVVLHLSGHMSKHDGNVVIGKDFRANPLTLVAAYACLLGVLQLLLDAFRVNC